MDEERVLTAQLMFEPDGDDYIYYSGTHSRGVRVTASEREVFMYGTTDGATSSMAANQRRHPGPTGAN